MTIGDGICQSIDIRNTASAFGIMKDCRVIEGFLQIVLIENNSERDFQPISFPLLREITGYLLLYRVNGLKTLSNLFPNLEVIRGNILLTDYAFMVYEMQNLQEVRYLSSSSSLLLLIFCVLEDPIRKYNINDGRIKAARNEYAVHVGRERERERLIDGLEKTSARFRVLFFKINQYMNRWQIFFHRNTFFFSLPFFSAVRFLPSDQLIFHPRLEG